MEIFIVLLILVVFLFMIFSFSISKAFSKAVFIFVFSGVAIAVTIFEGFNENWLNTILITGCILYVVWLRLSNSFADTAKAVAWSAEKFNQEKYSTCRICGKKMTYHRMPRNFNQLLFGGLSCENCGAESNISINAFMSK
jgi:hypothetical protein